MAGKFDWVQTFSIRWLILLPMAACIFLLLDSADRNVRLGAILGLIVLEQMRDWLLISKMRHLAKDNKPSQM